MKRLAALFLIILGTVTGLAGTDLILPAIPDLPDAIPGTSAQAQLVLAAFVAGTGIGLLLFGELGAHFGHRYLLVGALASYALTSLLATQAESIKALIIIRAVQGLVAAAPAVFAPAMIKAMFSEQKALRALGAIGSVESLAPALAPIVGAWLLHYYDWRASFVLIAGIAGVLALVWMFFGGIVAQAPRIGRAGGYLKLLGNTRFLRYSLSQAFCFGGLLIFVFGAPTVIQKSLGGTISDFVIMQILGISAFIIAANLADRLVARFSSDSVIRFGSLLSTSGFIGLLIAAIAGYTAIPMIWAFFLIANLGIGVRGPPGFYQAIVAAGDDDARGSALVILAILMTLALGTAAVAPFIESGLIPLVAVATLVSSAAVALVFPPAPALTTET